MVKRLAPVALVFVLIAPVSAQAQTSDLATVRAMQQQIDRLQAIVQAGVDTRMRVYIDAATPGFVLPSDCPTNIPLPANLCGPGYQFGSVVGWAFLCGPDPTPEHPETTGTLALFIDGVPAAGAVSGTVRYPRPDVNAVPGIVAYCGPAGMTTMAGAAMMIDWRGYASGSHTVQWRLTDVRGVVEVSNVVTVILP